MRRLRELHRETAEPADVVAVIVQRGPISRKILRRGQLGGHTDACHSKLLILLALLARLAALDDFRNWLIREAA
jgi:hypothetical protein